MAYDLQKSMMRILYEEIVRAAASLEPTGESEYRRGIVELIIRFCALSHDNDTEWVVRDINRQIEDDLLVGLRKPVTHHDYDPGDQTHPMYTDPLCQACGEPATRFVHR